MTDLRNLKLGSYQERPLRSGPGDLLNALDRVTKTNSSSLVDWVQDDAILAIVGSWPAAFSTPVRASSG